MINLTGLTIKKAHEAIKSGEYTCRELTQAYLDQIEKKNKELNVYLEVFGDALAQADEADKKFKSGTAVLLTGIPFAIKDNILIEGKKVSAASKMLENYIASYDATVIKKLKSEGAVFLGRVNLDEFAMGGSTENSAFGPTRNPHDPRRVAGGTSGGSTAAVAADMALVALGSDTGGSVREPASFCGIVGLKPTYGRVSRYGLMAMGSSLDCIGSAAKNTEDAEIVFRSIAGHDDLDSTSLEDTKENPINKKLTIGVPWDFINKEGVNPEVKKNFMASVEKLKAGGYEVKDISIQNIDLVLAIYYIIMPAEVSTNLARLDGVRYGLHQDGKNLMEDYFFSRGKGFGPETRRRVLLGTYVLSAGYYDAYYSKAQTARTFLKKEFEKAFKNIDLILTPTAPMPAWKVGEKSDPLSVYLADIFTVTANIVGIPAISVPSGFMEMEGKSLPLGIQFMAPHGGEDLLFEIGKKFEQIAL
ncbi:MAG TPA: Asp-tRNA(Asn)/Glu-tRNA(Gln) amidotransferase subunit GatA [Candidatus Paceibacterota bacterium]